MDETVGKICVFDKEKRDSLSYYWTKEKIELLKQHYPSDSWEVLFSLFPDRTKAQITHKASKLKISRDVAFWSANDINILHDGFNHGLSTREIAKLLDNKYNESAICTKATKLGLRRRRPWSEDEKELLKQVYEVVDSNELQNLFPNRDLNAVQDMGRKLGLHSYNYLCRLWSAEDDMYIIAHWLTMNDADMANQLCRTQRAVKWRREKLGLIKETPVGVYEYLRKYLWKENRSWRIASIKACDYKCVVTGGRFDDVHHLYGSNLIVLQALTELGLEYQKVSDYTNEELERIAQKYAELNMQYPLGVCLTSDIHTQFHKEYGYGDNTPDQFFDFIKKHYPNTQIPVTITAA